MTPPQASEAAVGAALRRLDEVVAEIRLEAKDQAEAGEDASVLRDWARRIAKSRTALQAPTP